MNENFSEFSFISNSERQLDGIFPGWIRILLSDTKFVSLLPVTPSPSLRNMSSRSIAYLSAPGAL